MRCYLREFRNIQHNDQHDSGQFQVDEDVVHIKDDSNNDESSPQNFLYHRKGKVPHVVH